MEHKAIFITVRSGSKRLPRKCLLKINAKTTIEHLIERVKRSKLKDLIILCTTRLKEDDALRDIAKKNNIECFRGQVTDKLLRWLGAAEKFKVDFFVTADGDDLFCEPILIDLAFSQFEQTHADFIEAEGLPCGAFTYGIKSQALKKVCRMKDTQDTEMMWTYFKDTHSFKVEKLRGIPANFNRPEIRMTLDYPQDLKFFRKVITDLSRNKKYFDLKDIIVYLDQYPQVIKINQGMQELYLKNQKAKTRLVLKESYA